MHILPQQENRGQIMSKSDVCSIVKAILTSDVKYIDHLTITRLKTVWTNAVALYQSNNTIDVSQVESCYDDDQQIKSEVQDNEDEQDEPNAGE
jgi:hypothetical protein